MALPARVRPDVSLGVQSLTVENAIDHLVEAAQGVVENQLELAKLDVELTLGRVVRGAVLAGVGLILLALAAAFLAAAAYAAFPAIWPPEQRFAIVAAVYAVLGTVVATMGVRQARNHGGD